MRNGNWNVTLGQCKTYIALIWIMDMHRADRADICGQTPSILDCGYWTVMGPLSLSFPGYYVGKTQERPVLTICYLQVLYCLHRDKFEILLCISKHT